MTSNSIADHRRQVMRYWEKRRWIYNGCLLPPTVMGYLPGAMVAAGVGNRAYFGWFEVAVFLAFAIVAANACYSVVYIPEFVLMGREKYGHFARFRTTLFVAGILMGMLLAYAVAHDIFWFQYDPAFAP